MYTCFLVRFSNPRWCRISESTLAIFAAANKNSRVHLPNEWFVGFLRGGVQGEGGNWGTQRIPHDSFHQLSPS